MADEKKETKDHVDNREAANPIYKKALAVISVLFITYLAFMFLSGHHPGGAGH